MSINKLLKSKKPGPVRNSKGDKNMPEKGKISNGAGSAIAAALLVVIILVVMGTGLLSLGLHSRMLATRTAAEIAARCAADAGLAKVVFEMNEKLKVTPWDDNTLPQATDAMLAPSDATFSYTVTSSPDYIYDVDVTGKAGREIRKVSCTLALVGLFRNAIYAQDSLVLENAFLIDAYSSEDGPYGGVNALQPTTVATGDPNAVAMGGGTIYGDILIDYGRELPAISPPEGGEFAVSKGPITHTITISEDGTYDYIDLTAGDTITISGDVTLYVTGIFEIKQFSEVEILPDSSLTLYLGGDLNLRNTSTVNALTQEPKRCQIFGVGTTDQSFLMEQSSVFYGTIYAPDATVSLENGAELYGAIIADNADLRNSAELHFDATLLKASVSDIGAEFIVQNWREE